MTRWARIGDSHSCPLPGHGVTPIVTGSGTVLINGRGAARAGDKTGCGAVILPAGATTLADGRAVARIGDGSSHGGVIIEASFDVEVGS